MTLQPGSMVLLAPTHNDQRSSLLFPNVGLENGSTQLKNLFLNNIGRKEEKNSRGNGPSLTVTD